MIISKFSLVFSCDIAADFVVTPQFFEELVVVGNLDALDSNIISYITLLGPICI